MNSNQTKGSNPWAIGTKFVKSNNQNQLEEQNRNYNKDYKEGSNEKFQKQPPQKRHNQNLNESYSSQSSSAQNSQYQSQHQNAGHKHIPKLKERNPFSALKQMEQEQQMDKFNGEIKGILSTFNAQQYSVAEFMSEVFRVIDCSGISSFEIVEFILSQIKIKDLFREFSAQQSSKIINSLIQSMQGNSSAQNKESCVKLMGHILFEDNEIDNQTSQKVYNSIQKLCFDPPLSNQTQQQQNLSTGGSGSSSQSQSHHKTQRLAMNCLANLLLRQTPFLKDSIDLIFQKLKNIFDQHMRKIEQNFKSKRFITMLTTIIRALQLSMSENQKLQQTLNDTECIKLYVNFYKILYLGTPFAEKMLNIKLEETKSKKGSTKISQAKEWAEDQEELKGDSGSFIIDTSEMSSSDGGFGESRSQKGGNGGKSPSSNDSITSSDPYQKIKNHAALCLQILLKSKNKSLFNYWYLLFPSFFLRSPTEFSPYLQTFPQSKTEFFTKLTQNISREPSLFYLLTQKDNSLKLRQTLCYLINSLLENSIIQRWQDTLETKDSYSSHQQMQASFVSISSYLGQFLRFLHYQMIFMISREKDVRMIQSYVKVVGALLQTTPYAKMNANLASLLIEELIKLNAMCSQSYHNENDQVLKSQVLAALSQAINNQELRLEFSLNFLKESNLIKQLLKIDKKTEFSHQIKDQYDLFNLLQKFCKNYPIKILEVYQPEFHDFLSYQLQSYDRKRICLTLNILEEWLKNFKSQNTGSNDEDGQDDENAAEQLKQNQNQDSYSPYKIQLFRDLMQQIINQHLLNKQNSYSDVSISILSLLCNLDQQQWSQIFDEKMTLDILNFLEHAKHPPLLKAASLKLLGYLVYFEKLFSDQTFRCSAYQRIFDSQSDSNQNVQIRNSWALANLCCLDQSIEDSSILRETLITCVNYSVSNKEKVSSNGIRALGYFLRNNKKEDIENRVIGEINKSALQVSRIKQNLNNQDLNIESILMVIINNLDNKSSKISWNSSVALANLIDNSSFNNLDLLYSRKTILPLLQALTSRPNFKTKIHASQTLLKFINIKAFSDKQLVIRFWETMLNSIEYINSVIPNQNDLKYLSNLEWNILGVWENLALLSLKDDDQSILQQVRDYIHTIGEFINMNALSLLQIMTAYLRKELKIPQYSGMYDEEIIKSETEQLFNENPQLEAKLNKLRNVIRALRQIIKNTEEVHVSFGVFEAFNSLADSDLKQFRLLDCLKGIKSNFDPTFEESKTHSESESVESDKSGVQ